MNKNIKEIKEMIKSLKPHPVVVVVLGFLVIGLLAYAVCIKKEVEFTLFEYVTFKAKD